jgi:hypothetical protein
MEDTTMTTEIARLPVDEHTGFPRLPEYPPLPPGLTWPQYRQAIEKVGRFRAALRDAERDGEAAVARRRDADDDDKSDAATALEMGQPTPESRKHAANLERRIEAYAVAAAGARQAIADSHVQMRDLLATDAASKAAEAARQNRKDVTAALGGLRAVQTYLAAVDERAAFARWATAGADARYQRGGALHVQGLVGPNGAAYSIDAVLEALQATIGAWTFQDRAGAALKAEQHPLQPFTGFPPSQG